jgi:hypothetical protein
MAEAIGKTWKEIAVGFLKVGATPYGGPAIMVASLTLIRWRLAPLKAMLGGSVFGVLRDRLGDLPGMRALLCGATWGR